MLIFRLLLRFSLLLGLHGQSYAVTTSYVSADDEDITIKSVVVTQGRDNVGGIYSKPLSAHLQRLIEEERFFELVPTPADSFDLDDLRGNAKQTSDSIKRNKADGLIHLQLSKGPKGLRFELGLFTKTSGLLWAYADALEISRFDLDFTRTLVQDLYTRLVSQLPYQGLLLSRTGNKVTVNRGTLGQLRPDQEINVIQVLSVKRHPQFQFITHVEKQIVGKIRITQADESLSFGYILFEKEPQVIQPGFKILSRDPVAYPALVSSKNESIVEHLLTRGDGNVMMKGDSKEWLPQADPTFGRMHALLGWGEFDASTNLSTSGSVQSLSQFALNAQFDADFWLTREWFIRAGINQGSVQVRNPLGESSPRRLNFSIQSTKLALGYDFQVGDHLHGPRLQALLGYSQFHAMVTNSTPTAFTSNQFNATAFGLVGYMPLENVGSKWGLGAEIWYHLTPRLSEKPVDSGSAKSKRMAQISGTVYYHTTPNLYWIYRLAVESYGANFDGVGSRVGESATSIEFNWRRLELGVEYLF